jgi:uncharacterized delta-60 repeat protein
MKKITLLFLFLATSLFAQTPGTLNIDFSQDGWDDSVYGNNNGFNINKTIIQPDGKILVCAEASFSNEGHQAVILRYHPNGTVDTTFGEGDGVVRSKNDPNINLYTRANGMAIQNNGKIIVAGDQFYNSERIFRLHADGTLDSTFGTDGVIDMNRPNSEFIYHVAVQSDNKIIVCGKESRFVNSVIEPHVFLWRFTADGVLDATFGNEGIVSYNSNAWLGAFETYMVINDLIILPDDKIVVNQSFTKFPNSFVMLRKFNANGTSDDSFGTNGEVLKSEAISEGNYKYSSSSIQEDGGIISSFTEYNAIDLNYTESLFRVNTSGELDPSLNINLGNPTNFPPFTQIIVSGNQFYYFKKVNQEGSSFDQIQAYDLSGNPITTFGNNGIAIIDQNSIPTSYPADAAVTALGNIYLASSITDPDNSENLLFLLSNIIGYENNLSIHNTLQPETIHVYPNPTSGITSISTLENVVINKIEVIDLLGKTIVVKDENTSQIDLSDMTQGMYLFKIQVRDVVIQKKIIKQ